eukprot:3940509-Rhodomonas_salina.3
MLRERVRKVESELGKLRARKTERCSRICQRRGPERAIRVPTRYRRRAMRAYALHAACSLGAVHGA